MCNPYQPINKRGTVVFKPEKTFLLFYQLLIIVVVSVLIYLYTLGNDFAYDDKFTITNNYLIRSWHKLPTIFTNDYFTSSGELSYRPVVTLSYFIFPCASKGRLCRSECKFSSRIILCLVLSFSSFL